MIDGDTIVALATALGRAAVSIIRISGPSATSIAENLCGTSLLPRLATYEKFTFECETVDTGIWLFFPAPNSFTGEDVVEFHGHGGPVVTQTALLIIQECGARLAAPGEFSHRAFLNNKIDLTQAEGICDLINASSRQAVKAANSSLDGSFGKQVDSLTSLLTQLRTHVEAHIDFPDEDIDPIALDQFQNTLKESQILIAQILRQAETGAKLNISYHVVLIGAPNSGKSSLLNVIAKQPLAIVTNIPGTTRDLVSHSITVNGYEIRLTDTAGIRQTENIIEQEGINRALSSIDSCNLVIALFDEENLIINRSDIKKLIGQLPNKPILLVRNKIDLNLRKTITTTEYPLISISAKTGENVEKIINWISSNIESTTEIDCVFLARDRHLNHLRNAQKFLSAAQTHPIDQEFLDLVAEDLRLAQKELSLITGKVTSEDLLTSIFSSFCIGK